MPDPPDADRRMDAGRRGRQKGDLARRLDRAAENIRWNPPTHEAVAFMQSVFASTYLPFKEPPPHVRRWVRENGVAKMVMTARSDLNPRTGAVEDVGLPYGSMARMTLAYFQTEAVHHGPDIEVGRSLRGFMRLLGYEGQGSEYRQMKEQARRFAAASVQLWYPDGNKQGYCSVEFVKGMSLWRQDGRSGDWQRRIVLSPEFFAALQGHAVPFDIRAFRALRQSPLAMDLYVWLAYRLHRLDEPLVLPWGGATGLEAQFLQGGDRFKFRHNFRNAMKKALLAYEQAGRAVEDLGEGGFRFASALPPVRRIGKR